MLEAQAAIENLIVDQGKTPDDPEVMKAEFELADLRIWNSLLSGVKTYCHTNERYKYMIEDDSYAV